MPLLYPHEPAPLVIHRERGAGRLFIVCEHAGRRIPERLNHLGLDAEARAAHIAWDIGAYGVARELSRRFDAPLAAQVYSRLVCDCNRPQRSSACIPEISETTRIPGNCALSAAACEARLAAVWRPFHDGVQALLEARLAAGKVQAFVAVHSFTPVYQGVARDMHCGLLHRQDRRLSDRVGEALRRETGLVVADNAPYSMFDIVDHTIREHAERRGLPYLLVEIRQDLIRDESGQIEWAARLETALREALD